MTEQLKFQLLLPEISQLSARRKYFLTFVGGIAKRMGITMPARSRN